MPKPLSLESELTKARIIEALDEIEADLSASQRGDRAAFGTAERKLAELRLALESKPLVR